MSTALMMLKIGKLTTVQVQELFTELKNIFSLLCNDVSKKLTTILRARFREFQ